HKVTITTSDESAQTPDQTFDVIVQADKRGNTNGLYKKLLGDGVSAAAVKQQFNAIDGIQASLSGQQILSLAKRPYVTSIGPNETVKLTDMGASTGLSNGQLWPWATGAPVDWLKTAPDAATRSSSSATTSWRTRPSTTSRSRTSPCTRSIGRASCSTRSTRQSRSCG